MANINQMYTVYSVATYASETWTMKVEDTKRLEALEMWIWRKCENISWRDKISNEEVLRRVGEKREIIRSITRRKRSWINKILKGDGLLKDTFEGRMEGKQTRGRPRKKMLDDLQEKYRDLKINVLNK